MKRSSFPSTLLGALAALAFFGPSLSAQEMPVQPEPESTSPEMPSLPQMATDTDSRAIQLMPGDKRALTLKTDERNPYSRRTIEVEIAEEVDGNEETESDRIRQVLTGLPMSGRSYGSRGPRVLAGDIIFEPGKLVPQVLEDQTEILVVEDITEEAVNLAWVDPETGQFTGKKLPLPFDLKPVVKHALQGQIGGEGKSEGLKFGVRRSGNPGQIPIVKRHADQDDVALQNGGANQKNEGPGQGQ